MKECLFQFNLIFLVQTHFSFTLYLFLRIKKVLNFNVEISSGSTFMIYDSQVYTALLIAVVASVLAIRLGATLYS